MAEPLPVELRELLDDLVERAAEGVVVERPRGDRLGEAQRLLASDARGRKSWKPEPAAPSGGSIPSFAKSSEGIRMQSSRTAGAA